ISIDGEPRGEFVFCAIEIPDQHQHRSTRPALPQQVQCGRARPSAVPQGLVMAVRPRPAVLCILDGWGHRPDPKDNAILDARTPNYDRLIATCPQGLIDASETFVGLPKGQMGNSEVGYMNLGAGRVAVPDLPRIDKAIEDGSLAKNSILAELIATLKKNGGACH